MTALDVTREGRHDWLVRRAHDIAHERANDGDVHDGSVRGRGDCGAVQRWDFFDRAGEGRELQSGHGVRIFGQSAAAVFGGWPVDHYPGPELRHRLDTRGLASTGRSDVQGESSCRGQDEAAYVGDCRVELSPYEIWTKPLARQVL